MLTLVLVAQRCLLHLSWQHACCCRRVRRRNGARRCRHARGTALWRARRVRPPHAALDGRRLRLQRRARLAEAGQGPAGHRVAQRVGRALCARRRGCHCGHTKRRSALVGVCRLQAHASGHDAGFAAAGCWAWRSSAAGRRLLLPVAGSRGGPRRQPCREPRLIQAPLCTCAVQQPAQVHDVQAPLAAVAQPRQQLFGGGRRRGAGFAAGQRKVGAASGQVGRVPTETCESWIDMKNVAVATTRPENARGAAAAVACRAGCRWRRRCSGAAVGGAGQWRICLAAAHLPPAASISCCTRLRCSRGTPVTDRSTPAAQPAGPPWSSAMLLGASHTGAGKRRHTMRFWPPGVHTCCVQGLTSEGSTLPGPYYHDHGSPGAPICNISLRAGPLSRSGLEPHIPGCRAAARCREGLPVECMRSRSGGE